MTIAQHSSKTNEHYTPAHIVESARVVLGGIDLDPASNGTANRRIRAVQWYGPRSRVRGCRNGLVAPWPGRVFCNPPGGLANEATRKRYQTKSNAAAWWRKLTDEYTGGRTAAAVFVGFTLELLRSTQFADGDRPHGRWPHPFNFTICVPRDRLRFGGDSPTHANVIVYAGPRAAVFRREFSQHGICK
jgi:hypothetical protein